MKRVVTLLFLRRNDEVLLAMKKRGFGVGKWNGVGGKVEPGETVRATAIRECQEEIGVMPINPELVGELHFFDLPDVEHYCYVYTTTSWEGDPHETEEMRPRWFKQTEIPYNTMWPDNPYWMPLLLADKPFKGIVTVDSNDQLLQHDITEVTNVEE